MSKTVKYESFDGFDGEVMQEHFHKFIYELSCRLADDPDYEELYPKLQELMNMVGWVVPEAWESRLGEAFMEEKNE
tara:strand:- start:342 stop:569 length:228 start_codon:yes stop_codon:yes gene_type:complete